MALAGILFRLEQIDTEIERAEAAVRDMERRQARNPALEAADARRRELDARVRAAEAEQRAREAALSDLEGKIKRDNTRMYSGQIVDPREIRSLERELEQYGARRDLLEEECLQGMEDLDALHAQQAAAEREAEDLRETWQESRPALARQAELARAKLAGLHTQREQLAGTIDPRALATYSRLRSTLGQAIAPITAGVCGACRVTLTQRDIQHARGEALVPCGNCGRVLYAE